VIGPTNKVGLFAFWLPVLLWCSLLSQSESIRTRENKFAVSTAQRHCYRLASKKKPSAKLGSDLLNCDLAVMGNNF
jgi:hypothetical protein